MRKKTQPVHKLADTNKKEIPEPKIVLSAKTKNQKEYIKGIIDNDLIFCTGYPGTGKTYIAIATSLILLQRNKIQRIYISKPMQSTGRRDFPYLPGSIEEKIDPYYESMNYIFRSFLGEAKYKEYLENGKIIKAPVELMRGMTLEDCCAILDESQNLLPRQIVMTITQMGQNCKMIFTGDVRQSDLNEYNGLEMCIDKLKNSDLAFTIRMLEEDIQRNPKISAILKELDWKKDV